MSYQVTKDGAVIDFFLGLIEFKGQKGRKEINSKTFLLSLLF